MTTQSTAETPIARYLAAARAAGSTALTTRGILKFVRANRVSLLPPAARIPSTGDPWTVRNVLSQAERDLRRARADARFRAQVHLRASAVRTLAQALALGDEPATIARRARALGRPAEKYTFAALYSRAALIPCSPGEAREYGWKSPRGRGGVAADWSVSHLPTEDIDSAGSWYFSDSDREGGYCPSASQYWTPGDHETRMQSVGVFVGRTCAWQINGVRGQTMLPPGFRWGKDTHGLRAISGPDDYHVSATDLGPGGAGRIVTALRANAETRRKLAAERLADEAEAQGILVCLADSLAAGNCRPASEDWARKHNLNLSRHYGAVELLRAGNGDYARVRLAIRAAIARTARENETGFCVLAEHAVA